MSVSAAIISAVIATGCGANYDSALKNAKINAMEQVTGTWVAGEKSLRDISYNEKVVEYNGGVITSYKVLGEDQVDSNTCVTINANVDTNKDNRVGTKSATISADIQRDLINKQEKSLQINDAVGYLDDLNKALSFKTKNVNYEVRGQWTKVTIDGSLSLSPKWFDDVKKLGETIDQRTHSNSSVIDGTPGAVIEGIALVNPFAGMATALAIGIVSPKEKRYNTANVVCFGATKDSLSEKCYIIDQEFSKFYKRNVDMKVSGKDGNDTMFNVPISITNVSVFDMMFQGTKRDGLFGMSNTYKAPTLVLFGKENMKVNFSFDVPTEKLSKVDKFEFNFN